MAKQIPFKQSDLTKAETTVSSLSDKLSSSPTAYSAADSSTSDLSANVALSAAKSRVSQLQSQRQKEMWYGPSDANTDTTGTQNEGILTKALNVLQAPLRAEVGAVSSILGKGSGKGIAADIQENVSTGHETYGDLMGKFGVPKVVSAPLGFAFDVVGDPVNWATAGTSTLVPKVGYGIAKGAAEEGIIGAVKGAGLAATSSLGEDVLGAAKYIPGVRGTETFKNAASKVFEAGTKYDALTGIDQVADAGKGVLPFLDSREGGFTIGSGLESAIKKIPGGDTLIEKMKYSPADYSKKAEILDNTFKIIEKGGVASSVPVDLERVGQMMNQNIEDLTVKKFGNHYEQMQNVLMDSVSDTDNILNNGSRTSFLMADGGTEFEARLAQEAAKDQEVKDTIDYFTKLNREKTGIEVFDKTAAWTKDNIAKFKIGNVDLGKKVLTAIDGANNIFKSSKVVMNPASHINSNAANVFFGTMKGFDMFDVLMGDSGASLAKVRSFYQGGQGADFLLKNIFNEFSDISRYAAEHPGEFTRTYALNISDLGGKYFIDELVAQGKRMGTVLNTADETALRKAAAEMPDTIRMMLEDASTAEAAGGTMREAMDQSIKTQGAFKVPSSLKQVAKDTLEGNLSPAQKGYSMLANEFKATDVKAYYEVKQKIAEKAADVLDEAGNVVKKGDIVYKALDGLLNKATDFASNQFELIDRSFKTTTALHMTNVGLTEDALKKIARSTVGGITEDDILAVTKGVAGEKRYKIAFGKATEIVNDTYMNYAAMPPIVRAMRAMPIIGAPFVSFTYGVLPKIGETLVNNPAAYNKINFLLHEISGNKTPLEKENMKSPYYQWFNSPGMVKLPIFQDFPIYANLANWIPYYGMNLFTPSDKKYQATVPGELQQMIDKTGLFGTPTGRMIWDYFIQPMLTPAGETTQNQFGQPIYPIGSSNVEKAGYAARSLAEAYVPSVAAPLGALVPEKYAQLIPSYAGRKFSEGMADKNQLGILKDQIPTLADVVKTQAINAASFAGVSLNPMDLTNLTNSVKKKIKK